MAAKEENMVFFQEGFDCVWLQMAGACPNRRHLSEKGLEPQMTVT